MSVNRHQHRLERTLAATPQPWKRATGGPSNAVLDCGWGRLLFGHTFESNEALLAELRDEREGSRDLALYISDPHVLLAMAPQELFLDPSHTYRLYLDQHRAVPARPGAFTVRNVVCEADAVAANRILAVRRMVPVDPAFVLEAQRSSRALLYLVAQDDVSGEILGTVTGVDHCEAFDDPEDGCSLWALAVDPQSPHPGIGQALATALVERFVARGRAFMDLSVFHDNAQAIALYEKLGFRRVPVFCIKRKNKLNEPLFIARPPEADLNPYAAILVREARRRGIAVEVLDQEAGYFALTFGGRRIVCRESLTELTSAIAMSRCDDKRVTRRVLTAAGLACPAQQVAGVRDEDREFLHLHERVVVKPARGEQGAGVSVDVRTEAELEAAIARARACADVAILEEMIEGEDLRIVVIDHRVVAAAVRRPPTVTGTGTHTSRSLFEAQSRRRAAATGGESHVPIDEETERCVRAAGSSLDDVLPAGVTITVRKAANLHTGGTIHDVTDELHPELARVAERASRALDIPVVGLDLIVRAPSEPEYRIIEANERPGLANHEPRPTAERFIDLLFPQTSSS